MPSVDPRVAEISRMKNKILEVDSQLKEGRKISARLRDHCEKKLQQIADVDQEITAEKERFRWQKKEMLFTMKSIEEESHLRITRMKEEEKFLLQDIAEFDVIQYENEMLHKKLKDLAEEQKIISIQQFEERERKKQKDFDLRMEMEEVFRKMIKSVDENYEREAIAKMQYEASQANLENERIHEEFDMREAKTEALIREQQRSYEALMKIRIERDVIAMSNTIQEKNIMKLRESNLTTEGELMETAHKLEKLRDEVRALSLLVTDKVQLQNECDKLKKEIELIQNEEKKYRKLTYQISKKLIQQSIQLTDKAAFAQNNALSEKLHGLTSGEDLELPSTPHTVEPEYMANYGTELLETIPEASSVLTREIDPESVWKLQSNSTSRLHSKLKKIKTELKYLSRSFSMQEL